MSRRVVRSQCWRLVRSKSYLGVERSRPKYNFMLETGYVKACSYLPRSSYYTSISKIPCTSVSITGNKILTRNVNEIAWSVYKHSKDPSADTTMWHVQLLPCKPNSECRLNESGCTIDYAHGIDDRVAGAAGGAL